MSGDIYMQHASVTLSSMNGNDPEMLHFRKAHLIQPVKACEDVRKRCGQAWQTSIPLPFASACGLLGRSKLLASFTSGFSDALAVQIYQQGDLHVWYDLSILGIKHELHVGIGQTVCDMSSDWICEIRPTRSMFLTLNRCLAMGCLYFTRESYHLHKKARLVLEALPRSMDTASLQAGQNAQGHQQGPSRE